jgi:hypothetical protein
MVRVTGLATVTVGGGGAACFWASPQPTRSSTKPTKAIAAGEREEDIRLRGKLMTKAGYI